ncbi:DUF1000-domain-containing protein [Lepidopterella palustris CBS 459.81]|uniref:DUF1000-domain-containing protein n=1 Tax=Lepidopterella palustris CBS 459.81 TaxID=1314670 RepID=A0A8E2E284_9PEZI|nr:DUF1000-domain-containing protein [Lepidopterella palustris CBS 459.81]
MSNHHHHHDGHDGHDHEHDEAHGHDHSADVEPALHTLLYKQIDFSALITLNEEESESGKAICKKTWAERLNREPELKSLADEQILMHIPFTGQVRLHSIILRTSQSPSAPKTLKVYVNRNDLDFHAAEELRPTQVLELAQTSEVQEIPVRRALFNTTQHLALFFEDNFSQGDEDVSRISYLAFKGTFMKLNKEPVSVLFEAAANPADHQAIVGTKMGSGHQIE